MKPRAMPSKAKRGASVQLCPRKNISHFGFFFPFDWLIPHSKTHRCICYDHLGHSVPCGAFACRRILIQADSDRHWYSAEVHARFEFWFVHDLPLFLNPVNPRRFFRFCLRRFQWR